jgi:Amt family ammonium transporter
VECGSVRAKNSRNILIKNLFDACLGAIAFYLVGYGLAFGDVDKGFAGTDSSYFAAYGFEAKTPSGAYVLKTDNYVNWLFKFSHAATASTIVSGSLAERTQLIGYTLFSFSMTCFIYPVVVGWTWGNGWLAALGFRDFAGCGIVHMLGGVAAFWGALICGARIGRFENPSTLKSDLNNRRGSMVVRLDEANDEIFNALKK